MNVYRCLACKHLGTNSTECVNCGRGVVVLEEVRADTAPDKLARTRPRRGLAHVKPRAFVPAKGEIASVLGGKLPRTGTILVTGPAGAGKSTLVAALALDLLRAGERVCALDAEMGDELAHELWVRAGATRRDLLKLERVSGEDGSWEEALEERAARRATVLVVDSLDEWSELASTNYTVLDDIRRNGPLAARALIFGIAHFSREGHLYGSVKADHRADAVVVVEVERIHQRKCTWAPKKELARANGLTSELGKTNVATNLVPAQQPKC